MPSAWPDSVERVASFLREAGAEARLEEFATGTPTAAEAAEAAGCGIEQIVKSLVFATDAGELVLALVPGDRRADPAKIALAAGARTARVATPEEVEEATGFAPGAVAPFPLPPGRRVVRRPDAAHACHRLGRRRLALPSRPARARRAGPALARAADGRRAGARIPFTARERRSAEQRCVRPRRSG